MEREREIKREREMERTRRSEVEREQERKRGERDFYWQNHSRGWVSCQGFSWIDKSKGGANINNHRRSSSLPTP